MPVAPTSVHGSSRLTLFSRQHSATHTLRHRKGLHIQLLFPSVPKGGAIDYQSPERLVGLEGNYGGTKEGLVYA